ncbi:MAG: glycosyl hydrolase 2 galactose-binding domain-containing protein [Acidobacteriota bacterium]
MKKNVAAMIRQEISREWIFREASSPIWHEASVPGCVHTDLMACGLIPGAFNGANASELQWIGEKDWVYQCAFPLPEEVLAKEHCEIVFRGLDTYASVYMNDSLLLKADNTFREWRADVRPFARHGQNKITIFFRTVFDETIPRRTTCGICRPVAIEAWDSFRIRGVHLIQERVDKDEAVIISKLEIESDREQRVGVSASADASKLAANFAMLRRGLNTVMLEGKIAKPKLWWCNGLGPQHLYRYTALVAAENGLTDEYVTSLGVRSLRMVRKKDASGTSLCVQLNGIPVFMKGAHYIPPDTVQSRVGNERHQSIVRAAAEANMNMLRIWGGGIFEEDSFYEMCDRYGILIWNDVISACALDPAEVQACCESYETDVTADMERYYPEPKDVPASLYMSRLVQADAVRMAIEAHRRSMSSCMDSLFWPIEECRPLAFWPRIDDFGRWNAIHYAVKHAYAPVLIAPKTTGDSVAVSIVSDAQETLKGLLYVYVREFGGKILYVRTFPVTVRPNSSRVYLTLSKRDLLGGAPEDRIVLVSRFAPRKGAVAENFTYFTHPKDLALEQPAVTIAVRKVKKGFEISLSASTLARNVCVTCDEAEGFFSDNFFDLLPHEAKTITLETERKIRDVARSIRIVSLVDMDARRQHP